MRERELPFAVLGNNVIGEWDASQFDTVYSDDLQGAFESTSHLIEGGHRDIWFIGDEDYPWYARCADGYRRCMLQAGLQPRLSEIHSEDRQLGYLATRSIVSRGEPVTAVFAGSDQIASGVYEALREVGLRIPEDVSVAGFNDSEATLMDPPLTSVREFPEELGRHLSRIRTAPHPGTRPRTAVAYHPDQDCDSTVDPVTAVRSMEDEGLKRNQPDFHKTMFIHPAERQTAGGSRGRRLAIVFPPLRHQ